MQAFRLFSTQALQAGVLSGGVRVDTVQSASADLHPAIVPNTAVNPIGTGGSALYTAPQIYANSGGIAPTTGTNTQTGQLNRNTGNAWADLVATGGPASPQVGLVTTTHYGDYLTLVPPTTTVLVQVQLAGMLQSGQGFKSGDTPDGVHTIGSAMVRNGARIAVATDTNAPVVYDTYNQTVVVSVTLDGLAQHAVTVQHVGMINPAAPVISGVTAVSGTLASGVMVGHTTLQSPSIAASSLVSALWTITYVSSSTFTVSKTTPGGSPTVIGTYNTNTVYDSAAIVPGVAFSVTGPLTSGSATFITDQSFATIQQVTFYTASGSAAGVYTSPIMDSGDPGTQWFLYEHTESYFATNPTTQSVTASVSNAIQTRVVGTNSGTLQGFPAPISWLPLAYVPGATNASTPSIAPSGFVYPRLINANPDATTNSGALTYSSLINAGTVTLTMSGVTLPVAGERRNDGSLQAAPTGQYCQFTLSLATATLHLNSWAREFRVWGWNTLPTQSPLDLGKMAFMPNWRPGPLMQGYIGTLVSFQSEAIAGSMEFNNSFGVGTAVGQALLQRGLDMQQPVVTGEPTSAYQNRLSNFIQAKSAANFPTTLVTTGTGTVSAPLVTVTPGTGVTTISPVSGDQGTLQSICAQVATLISGLVPVVSLIYTPGSPFVIASGGGVSVTQLGNRGVSISLPNPPYLGLPGLAVGTSGGVDNPAKSIIKNFCTSLMPVGSLFNPNSSTYLNFNSLG